MKCHICNQNLIRNSAYNWEVGNRRSVNVNCRNKICISNSYGINIIEPEKDIEYYYFPLLFKNKWYCIHSTQFQTTLYKGKYTILKEQIISIDKFCSLNLNQELGPQLHKHFLKLKNLIIFS